MKKILSLFLVLVMLLSLCACNKNESQNTDSSSNSSHSSTDNTEESTNSTTEEEQETTENSTTTSSEGEKETTKQPTPESNKQESIEKPITTPTKDPTSAPTESTQEPVDEPDENPADEPSDCEHTYPTVTCTIPKMCTKCHHVAGKALPHNYKNGSCTVCGMAEMLVTFREGYWVAYTVKSGTSEQGEILSEYVLDPELDRFSSYMCFSNATACFLDKGKITYNDKAYHSDWYFTVYMRCNHEDNGDTITITVENKDNPYSFVLSKTSETQLTVISSTNTVYVPVGIVFVKQ